MIKVITRIDTDLIVVVGECHLGIDLSIDRIIEEGHNMLIIMDRNYFRRRHFRETQTQGGQHYRGGHRSFGRGRSRLRERQYSSNFRRDD